MVGQDLHRCTRRNEEQHKRREAWLIGFFWGATAAMALYAFAMASGKVMGLLP